MAHDQVRNILPRFIGVMEPRLCDDRVVDLFEHVELGRHDADFGSILVNKANGEFGYEKFNGLAIKRQLRQIGKINISGKESFILAKNNDSLQVIQFTESLKKNN